MVCCFTGHRPQHLQGYGSAAGEPILRALLLQAVEDAVSLGVTEFLCGMAMGVDLLAAQSVYLYGEQHPDTRPRLIAVLPCRDQASRWPHIQRVRYDAVLARADQTLILQEQYSDGCMRRRNEYMVAHSDRMIAVFNGHRGGTSLTVRLAKQKGMPITFVLFTNAYTKPSAEALGDELILR